MKLGKILLSENHYEIIKEIAEYLTKILSSDSYDIVVCNERRGLVLFIDSMLKKHNIPFYSQKALDTILVKGKNVLVFDDSINSGQSVKRIANELESKGASKIKIAAYVKQKNCKIETLEPKYLVDKDGYEKIKEAISSHIEERLIPPDTDHIYVIGHLSKNVTIESIKSIFCELGETYTHRKETEDNIEQSYDGIKLTKFGIYANDILNWKNLNLPPYVTDMPSWKIRINCQDQLFCIIPIAFPELDNTTNLETHDFKLCLCKNYYNENWRKSHDDAEALLTCYCIIINSQLYLLQKFLKQLNEKLKAFDSMFILDDVNYSDAKNLFGDSSLEKKLWDILIEELK
jgi:hypoxanthine phosphoribosyltransferase